MLVSPIVVFGAVALGVLVAALAAALAMWALLPRALPRVVQAVHFAWSELPQRMNAVALMGFNDETGTWNRVRVDRSGRLRAVLDCEGARAEALMATFSASPADGSTNDVAGPAGMERPERAGPSRERRDMSVSVDDPTLAGAAALAATRSRSHPTERELRELYVPRDDDGAAGFAASVLGEATLGGGFRGVLLGQPGVGKTTEVLRLAETLRGRFVVRYVDAGDHLTPDDAISFAAVVALAEAALDGGAAPGEGVARRARDAGEHGGAYAARLSARVANEEAALGRPVLIVVDGIDRAAPGALARAVRDDEAGFAATRLRLVLIDKPWPEWADLCAALDGKRGFRFGRLYPGPLGWVERIVRRRAGEAVMDTDVVTSIARASGGVPRDALALAYTALLNAQAAGHSRVMLDDLSAALVARGLELRMMRGDG